MPDAWINPQGGASGDMFLSALIHCGANPETISQQLQSLNLKQAFKIESKRETLRGFAGIQTHIRLKNGDAWEAPEEQHHDHKHHHHHDHGHHHHVAHRDIAGWIKASSLAERVKERSLAIFHVLAEAEAEVHGKSVDDVAFHEVGATDSIVDIVGTAIALEELNINQLYASAVGLGSGQVSCAHGKLPLPAPATSLLLRNIPVFETGEHNEMCTPTGAAILKALASFDQIPGPFRIQTIGLGLSHRIPEHSPPFLRISLIEKEKSKSPFIHEQLVWLSCNLDDMNPEYIPLACDRLQKIGALDVSLCPIVMKKGRSGHELRALLKPELEHEAVHIMLEWTSSFGVRVERLERYSIEREMIEIKSPWGPVRVKRGHLPKEQIKHHIEYDDVKAICDKHDVSWRDVIDSLPLD